MGIEYNIKCHSTGKITKEKLQIWLNVTSLDMEDFSIRILEDANIYFCKHSGNDPSRIAFARIIEMALSGNEAVVISGI